MSLADYADVVQGQNLSTYPKEFAYNTHKAAMASSSHALALEARVWALYTTQKTALDFFSSTVAPTTTTGFYEQIFGYLITGHGQKAAELAAQQNNWDLKSVIELDNIPLLQQICRSVAHNQLIDKWERGCYGLLSGDLDSVVPLCTSWEAELVARLNSARFNNTPIAEAVEALQQSPHQQVRRTAKQPMYRIFEALLCNNLDAFLAGEGQRWLQDANTSTAEDDEINLLRVLAHLCIVRGVTQDTQVLVHAYIENLMIEGELSIVPAYVRFLLRDKQTSVYASVLLRVDDSDEARGVQVGLARRYGLDITAACLEATNIKFADFFNSSQPSQPLVPLSEMPAATVSEQSIVSTIKWLVLVHEWDQLVLFTNKLVSFWLLVCRLPAVLYAGEELPLAKMVNLSFGRELESARIELRNHIKLISFFTQLQTDAAAALARVSDFEQYMLGVKDQAARLLYVPYGILELAKALDNDGKAIMDLAVHIASVPQLTALFQHTDKLTLLMQQFAQTVLATNYI